MLASFLLLLPVAYVMYGASRSNDSGRIFLIGLMVAPLSIIGGVVSGLSIPDCNHEQRPLAFLLILFHLVLPAYIVWAVVNALMHRTGFFF